LKIRWLALGLTCVMAATALPAVSQSSPNKSLPQSRQVKRVLLLSIDGFHAVDLANYVKLRPNSALAKLSGRGVTYTNASSSFPSNSWPGLVALITGGTSVSTGVVFENSYDRSLSPPSSNCATRGTEIIFDSNLDLDKTALDGGGGLDPMKLPRDPANGCKPVYPHDFLRANTIFEVIRQAGGRTAWSDQHLAYEFTNGPSGHGVQDLYTPESAGSSLNMAKMEQFDDIRVQAILHQVDGMDHAGKSRVGVPTIFGMNFQAVTVGQKLPGEFGYTDSNATPTANLLQAFDHTDYSIGRIVDELEARGLSKSTLVIVTAKHGNTPIDPAKREAADLSVIPAAVNGVKDDLLAAAVQDGSVALIWLTDQSRTDDVVAALREQQQKAHIEQIFAGEALKLSFNDPATDPRVPDIIVQPTLGTLYVSAKQNFIAEHGGMSDPDMHVPLLLSMPGLKRRSVKFPVQISQVAPTILKVLGLEPLALKSVQVEKTPLLPGLSYDPDLSLPIIASEP
jgi:predicted AlkP superfamily pyrophosphatase or phosphodiesterase